MGITCSPAIERIILQHNKLIHELRYPEARHLIFDALVSLYERSPISLDVAALLDQLAIDCIDIENGEEAALYLANSFAIKILIFGADHKETTDAKARLDVQMPDQMRKRRERQQGDIHETLDNFLGVTTKSDDGADVDTSRIVKCLVIAKKPPEKYFGYVCSCAGYTVVCEDGQIACLNPQSREPIPELELGDEIEAKPLRLFYGRLWLTLHRKLESEDIVRSACEPVDC